MPEYLVPGVFVEEQDTGSRPIEAVGTSTGAFVGTAPLATAPRNVPLRIRSAAEFLRLCVGDSRKGTHLSRAVLGFYANGGSVCWVVNLGGDGPIAGGGVGLDVLEPIDEIAMIAAPGRTDATSYDMLLSMAERMGDRIALLDGPETADDVEALTRVAGQDGGKPAAGAVATSPGLRARSSARGYGAYYFPWLRMWDPIEGQIVSAPPSGHVAGIFARTDSQRGVWKAPANAIVSGASGGLSQPVTRADQGLLNPAGVNCFRWFGTDGTLLWGARTLASDPAWRYVNVRRLFIMVEKSIERATRWVVFEPNDGRLWKNLRRDLSAFLTRLWSQGALMGATPDQAFFVKCDDDTNTQDVIDAGQVVTIIGLAPVKPAEFVIFRIGQSAAGATVTALS